MYAALAVAASGAERTAFRALSSSESLARLRTVRVAVLRTSFWEDFKFAIGR